MEFKIKKEEVQFINETDVFEFPKYTSQLINWANQNAQGTRPKVVGQLSELFPEFQLQTCDVTVENWENWYYEKYPDNIDIATDKIFKHIQILQQAIKIIDRDLVNLWVKDLVINKTFNGLYIQKAILSKLADLKQTTFRLACPDEEAKGIDGYVGDIPYSIKPDTYKLMDRLPEVINVKMIRYIKNKNDFTVTVEE